MKLKHKNMKALFILAAAITFTACTQRTNESTDNSSVNGDNDSLTAATLAADSTLAEKQTTDSCSLIEAEEEELEEVYESSKSLNDIRFENWSESDNYDNPYFREIRNFLNGNKGERNLDISAIEEQTKGEFMIHSFEPAMMGGLMVNIFFTDHPKEVYSVWVYSFVDEKEEKVIGYEIRYFEPVGEQNITEEDIKDILRKIPMIRIF